MMAQQTVFSRVIGTGSYLPPDRVTNQALAERLAANGIETSDEWKLPVSIRRIST